MASDFIIFQITWVGRNFQASKHSSCITHRCASQSLLTEAFFWQSGLKYRSHCIFLLFDTARVVYFRSYFTRLIFFLEFALDVLFVGKLVQVRDFDVNYGLSVAFDCCLKYVMSFTSIKTTKGKL